AGPGRQGADAPRAVLQRTAHSGSQPEDWLAEDALFQGAIPRPVPQLEQAVRQSQQPPADRLPGTAAVDHRLEVATEVTPTDLPPVRRQPVVGLEPVATDDLILL